MTKLQPPLMEVTRALSDCARAADFDFGEDTAIVAVQHMLWQTVDLFEALVSLGVKRENIFALGKVYSNSPVVIESLRERGITVVESTMPAPAEFDLAFNQDVNRLWDVAARRIAARHIKHILILDDGGKCITNMPRELLRNYAVAGVEQTSFGIFMFEKHPPPVAVMSWARAAVKLQIGGSIFSHCLLMKLQSRLLRGRWLKREDVGVVGLGSIGGAMANLAARQENNVTFYDPDPQLQVPDYLQGRVTRVDSLEELMLRCDYVFGCSGRDPFKDKWPMKHRPGIQLLSASGGDQEFRPIIDDLRTKPDFNVARDTWDIRSEHGPSGRVFIAYMGYPYNFVSRDIEAVPTGIVQVETGGLLAGLIQARLHLALCEKGHEENYGIHRISPEVQRFVFKRWLRAVESRRIDLQHVYSYDPATLAAARNESWFSENSEPRPSMTYEPSYPTESLMAGMIEESGGSEFGGERKLEPNLCSS